jgi:2-keto-4-pentenoate hydratase
MDVTQAAELIWTESQQGRYFPEPLRGKLTLDEALRAQLGVLERKKAAGEAQAGWKVGLTSARVRARYGSEERPFGHIMAHRVFDSGVEVPAGPILNCAVEPELCFLIGETLRGPDVTPEAVRAAVAGVSAGYELNEGRSGGVADFPLTVADNLSQWGIVIGETLKPIPADFDFAALRMEIRCNGESEASSVGADVIDDHYLSLSILANNLAKYGLALETGQRVITGSYSKHDAKPGETWRAEFAGIGAVEAKFV